MPARWTMRSGADVAGNVQMVWTSETASALFSAGYTDYGDQASGHAAAVREALLRASRGKLVAEAVMHTPHPGGSSFTVEGLATDGSPRSLRIWLFPRDKRLYQLAVIARPEAVSEAEAEVFLLSFKTDN